MYYDKAKADHVCEFFSRFLVHVKGKWAGKPFHLLPWQEDLLRWVFGWRNDDGTRLIRMVYVEVPRKNGKSNLLAGIAIYLLTADKEPGVEVYSCAADRDQAAIVFELAKQMVEASPELSHRVKPYRRSLVAKNLSGSYKPLSADVPNKHGLNAHGVMFDELHAQPNRDLWDVMKTSTGARQQPLIMAITTAGFDKNSICWEVHEYAERVLSGIVSDPTFCAVIYKADEEDDWAAPETWRKANPSLGETVSEDFLRSECQLALETPAYQNTFRRLYLNQWTQQDTRYIDMGVWDASAGIVVAEKFKGKTCYAGLDLSSTQDISALSLLFCEGDKLYNISTFWIPEDTMLQKERKDKVPYREWARRGLIIPTPGNVVDYQWIRAKLHEYAETYDIEELAYDPWNATMLATQLADDGFNLIPTIQGMKTLSPPTKELARLVLEKRLVHGANPVLRWMANNMAVKQDEAGNVKPDKAKSSQRIDGMVALIMALDRASRHLETASVYEERGILWL